MSKHYRLGVHINARASWFEGDQNCPPYNGEQDPTDSSCKGLTPLRSLEGSLDGGDFEIRNLYIHSRAEDVGLFRSVDGHIKDLHLRRVRINKRKDNAGGTVGALLGHSHSTSNPVVNNCSVTGQITSSGQTTRTGGLIGDLQGSSVFNSWADVGRFCKIHHRRACGSLFHLPYCEFLEQGNSQSNRYEISF